jgi:methionyl-tRNA synthetase
MSKSTGNVVDPVKAIQTFGSDGVRFFLMKQGGSLPQDSGELINLVHIADLSDYSDLTLNAEYQLLSNQIGNLAARIGVPRMFQKIKPLPLRFSEPVLDDMLFKLPQKYIALMDKYEISKACEAILEVVAEVSRQSLA